MPENQSAEAQQRRRQSTIVGITLLVVLAPLWILLFVPMWLVVGALFAWIVVVLQLATGLWWLPRGRRVIFVYSNSPVWQAYVEANILPRLPASAVVLNWSERAQWPFWSLAVWIFNLYGGSREYNPIAIVIRPLRTPRRFRFWRAFRDFKHGKSAKLREVEKQFFDYIGDA
jgi:hypothetical protein